MTVGAGTMEGSLYGPGTEAMSPPLLRLVAGDWLAPAGVPGVFGFTPKFELALARLQRSLSAADPLGSVGPHWYPPVISAATIDRAQYAEAFAHLLGTVHARAEDTAEKADSASAATDIVLAPAVCYSVYAQHAGKVLGAAVTFDAAGYCYRHEATSEVGRFRSFRMREFGIVAGADAAWQFREAWIRRCTQLFADWGLAVSVESATDPFFGPGARFMRSSQLQQSLKYEFVVPLHDADPGTAIASANCHKEHLGERFGIAFADEGTAHSSCMAFGLERVVLALVHVHGDDLDRWPAAV